MIPIHYVYDYKQRFKHITRHEKRDRAYVHNSTPLRTMLHDPLRVYNI